MQKKHSRFLIILLLSVSISAAAQKEKADAVHVIKATILNPGISGEFRFAPFQTVYTQVSLNPLLSRYANKYKLYITPSFTVQDRNYFNYRKRAMRGLRTEMNSMNYVAASFESSYTNAPMAGYGSKTLSARLLNTVGLYWGMQRNYPRRFSLDLNFGPAYQFTRSTYPNYFNPASPSYTVKESRFTFWGQLNIGIWLNARKL